VFIDILRIDFDCDYRYIFRNAEPEFGWNARERALTASQHLRKQLTDKLPKDTDGPSTGVRSKRFWNTFTNVQFEVIHSTNDQGRVGIFQTDSKRIFFRRDASSAFCSYVLGSHDESQ